MENTELDTSERSPEAQAIIDAELGVEPQAAAEEEEELTLPSDENAEPELLAGKYSSVDELKKGIINIGSNLPEYVINGMSEEALEQHYSEIRKDYSAEKKDGRKHAEKKDSADKAVPEKSDDVAKTEVSQELWAELDTQFTTTGSITGEQYDKLNAQGIPDVVIDKYIDGMKSEQAVFTDKMYGIAGGKEEFESVRAWAEDNEPDTVAVLNGMTDYNQMLAVMKGVKASYDASNAPTTGTFRGSPQAKSGARGYQSEADYNADVSDARYRTDPRFRDRVKAKLSKSNLTS